MGAGATPKCVDNSPSHRSWCRFGTGFTIALSAALLINGGWWLLSSRSVYELLYQILGTAPWAVTPAASPPSDRSINAGANSSTAGQNHCDLSLGRWVAHASPPLYTNDSCKYIHPSQNCMTNGRPDRGYLHWKWQPMGDNCRLPDFDPRAFLGFLRGKTLMFAGDSIARNHKESLVCALSQVEEPQNLYYDVKEKESTWFFPSYNFTIGNIWSPFLVSHTFEQGIYHIHLDLIDTMFSMPLSNYDIVVLSTGYWYFRPSIYYTNNTILGTNPHSRINLTTYDMLQAMQDAWDTVLSFMVERFIGMTIVRTITVPHFESGTWSSGGNCNKTQPFFDPNMEEPLPWMSEAITRVQFKAFKKAMDKLNKSYQANSIHLKLLNVTYSSLLRPDGHPGQFRIQKPNEPRNDCLHWCLPGPIDMWNQLLLHILQS